MNWKIRYSDFQSQFRKIESQMMGTIHRVLSRGDLLEGNQRKEFEEALSQWTGTNHAFALSRCSDAVTVALQVCGIGSGDDVIASCGGINSVVPAIIECGARPVLVDVGDDHLMDPQQVAAAISPQTKAIVPVHANGHCADMKAICEIAQQNDCCVIEDATSGLGANLCGKPVGSFGTVAVFDLGSTSMLSGLGDAGAVVTSDEEMAARLAGLCGEHTPDSRGGRKCLNNLQAAVLELKLKHLPDDLRRRRELAEIYHRALRNVSAVRAPLPPTEDGYRFDVFHRYEIHTPFRNDQSEFLTSRGVQHELPQPLSRMASNSEAHESRPISRQLQKTGLFLPLHAEMTNENVEFVVQCVDQFHRTRKEQNRAA